MLTTPPLGGTVSPSLRQTLVVMALAFLSTLPLQGALAQSATPPEAGGKAAEVVTGTPATETAAPETKPSSSETIEPAPKTVTLVKPRTVAWELRTEARGSIQPWQEIHISSEVGGLRVINVSASTGDLVKKGQVLARLNAGSVETELDTANAQLVEAKAAMAQAAATLDRANRLAPSGGVSKQELTLYETQKHTAEAKLTAAKAQVKKQQLRLDLATIVAPDDGLISSRSIAEGAIVQSGSELFRLIRQGRLQWRAEVKGELLLQLAAGQEARIRSPLGEVITGRVRQISPTIDPKTQNGWVLVDLPSATNLKAGLSVAGDLTTGQRKVLTLPASAILNRNGIAHVFKVDANSRIEAMEVLVGESKDGLVEVAQPLTEHIPVVAKDVENLTIGEQVSIQDALVSHRVTETRQP